MSLTEEQRRQRRRERRRMAGDAMTEQDPATDTPTDETAREAGFRNSLERRLGSEEYGRIGARGHQDPDNAGNYSAREVISEFRNRDGETVDDVAAHFKKLQADGVTFNKRAKDYLTSKHGFEFGGNVETPETPDSNPDEGNTNPTVPTPEDQSPGDQVINPTPGGGGAVDPGSMVQNVNQDNDIINNVSGSNNNIVNNQDNSISQMKGYGGTNNSSWKDAWMTNYFG